MAERAQNVLPARTPSSPVLGFAQQFISDLTGRDLLYSPAQPMIPVAPVGQPVRRWDYWVAQNLMYIPRATEAVKFEQLRWAASTDYVTRMIIETRKDQIARVPHTIRPKKQPGESNKDYRSRSADDEGVQALTTFFEHPYPDPEWSYAEWCRALLEDLFVIDAPTVYVLRETPGDIRSPVLGLDVIDGATITPLIDSAGRRPRPPDPAYQQIIKGLPAVDLHWGDLVYRPRNKRADKLYGFSPVEQIILLIDFSLRRDLFKRSYYTEGNMPEAIVQMPETYTIQQIESFQDQWDSILSGQVAQRRKIHFIPGIGGKDAIQWTKLDALKDELDEWLVRLKCFPFSISPQPFVREMNRATAQSAQEQAKEEGLEPLLNWLAAYFTYLINVPLGQPDHEWAWLDDREVAKDVQAVIDATHVKEGIRTRNEVRDELGLDPIEGGDVLSVTTATGLVAVTAVTMTATDEPDAHAEDTAVEKRRPHPQLATPANTHRVAGLEVNIAQFLARQGAHLAAAVQRPVPAVIAPTPAPLPPVRLEVATTETNAALAAVQKLATDLTQTRDDMTETQAALVKGFTEVLERMDSRHVTFGEGLAALTEAIRHQPAPVVHVAAPVVHVEPTPVTVKVAPTPVTMAPKVSVEATLKVPKRKTTITRGKNPAGKETTEVTQEDDPKGTP